MHSKSYSVLSVVLAQLALFLSLVALDIASCEDSSAKSIQNSRQKRSSVSSDILTDNLIAKDLMDSVYKRAPGWGKRFSEVVGEDGLMEDKQSSSASMEEGWNKRAPGWGKRAPGWGKRAPGWGKRAPGWGKRAPGWGKRAPGWGKRAPGWGKRSNEGDVCKDVDMAMKEVMTRAMQLKKMANCGLDEDNLAFNRK